ncbi:MAG: alpha-N-arabinofuranosidase [Halodesulfurarchaeum sp.]
MASRLYLHRTDPIGEIESTIYGHFAEHLGRCIYGGIWVGEDEDRVPTEGGIRRDTVELLAELDMPVLRWPGGCFADDYHWTDGIGPREDRPTRRNAFWTQGRSEIPEEPNSFGTEEFIRLCELLDTEPYLAANVGSGTPGEAADWLEYCNYDGDTELVNRRRANGSEEPHDVKYWGVGNENWGCGGRLSPEEYAEQFRRYATYLQSVDGMLSDRDVDLVAVGHINDDWNRRFLDALEDCAEFVQGPYDLMDHLSVHRYYEAGSDTDFDEEEYFRLLARSRKVGADVDDAVDALSTYAPESDISIIVDEWGVWHPEATNTNGLEQENTVRDAISAAGVFDDLHDRADVVAMANIAQTVNVLQCLVQTNETEAWATPTYQVFDLYENHAGGTSLSTVVDTDERGVEDEPFDVPLISASASQQDGELFVTLSNRALESETVQIETGFEEASVRDSEVLFAEQDVREYSTSANAGGFSADDIEVDQEGNGVFVVDAPASSVVGVTLRV